MTDFEKRVMMDPSGFAILTKDAAWALKSVSKELYVQGYCLKVFDAYRPVTAIKHFMMWGLEDLDLRMKPFFYPDLDKRELFAKGYIAKRSSHSRGSTVDLTLLEMSTGREVDMGSPFDLFSEKSHPDYSGSTANGGILPWATNHTRTRISIFPCPRRI